MKIAASAAIGGKKTNRVRMRRIKACCGRAYGDGHTDDCLNRYSTGRHKSAYRRDREIRDVVTVCVSMTAADLAIIDAAAKQAGMARSHYLRSVATAHARTVYAPWFIRLSVEPGEWCRWPR